MTLHLHRPQILPFSKSQLLPLLSRHSRSLASLNTTYTIRDVIHEDHHDLSAYHHKLLTPSISLDTKSRYQNQFSWLLAKHIIGEEIVLYPAYETYLGSYGRSVAERDREGNQVMKDRLEYFQRLYPQSGEFEGKLGDIMKGVRNHIVETEERELPRLEEAMTKEENERLGRRYRRMMWFLPTRAHPWIPNKPPYETVLGFLSTPVDQLGDVFRRFPDEEDLLRTEEEYRRSKGPA
ncbi:hypothetical protein BZA77DRAFT_338734 [Pyronema omphalodes]|nr:hypothetical protein BZA77DRAFT_338734 [Pyronema omphalodes]